MINRVDRRSQLECLKQCGQLLKEGASVLFFPEGTRSKDGRMHAFKKGAFSVAAKAKVGGRMGGWALLGGWVALLCFAACLPLCLQFCSAGAASWPA